MSGRTLEGRAMNVNKTRMSCADIRRAAQGAESKNYNDSPVPGLNAELDFLWLEDVARRHVGYGSSDHWSEIDRAAVLLSLVLMDCTRTIAKAIDRQTVALQARTSDA